MTEEQIARFLQSWAPLLIPLGLILGPTILFRLISAFLGRGRRESPVRLRVEATGEPLDQLIERGDMWLCAPCRALNTPGAVHCYRCGADRPAAQPAAAVPPDAQPVAPSPGVGVPVMATTVARLDRAGAIPAGAMPARANHAGAAQAGPIAARMTHSGTVQAGATPPGVIQANTIPAAAVQAGAIQVGALPAGSRKPRRPAKPAGSSSEPQWCPLLGVQGNPHMVFTFPHANNRCYALAEVTPIEADDQRVFCLTSDHTRCLRYRSLSQRMADAAAPATAAAGSRRRARPRATP